MGNNETPGGGPLRRRMTFGIWMALLLGIVVFVRACSFVVRAVTAGR